MLADWSLAVCWPDSGRWLGAGLGWARSGRGWMLDWVLAGRSAGSMRTLLLYVGCLGLGSRSLQRPR